VKTIYLPNEQLNTVAVENDEIRRQLEENRQNYLIEIERLREELRQRENELLKSHEDTQEKIRVYIDSNYRLQKDNIAFVKGRVIEFFVLSIF
jgi:predicted transcriptional regulator